MTTVKIESCNAINLNASLPENTATPLFKERAYRAHRQWTLSARTRMKSWPAV